MAFTASGVIQVQSDGSDSTGNGIFDPGVSGMDATASVASANTSAPVVTVTGEAAGDVNMWFYLKSGTNSVPGWYPITAVDTSAHTYTLNAAIGAAVLTNYTTNTAVGCCSSGTTLSSVTWAVDFSQTSGNITTGTASSAATTLTATTGIFRKPMIGNGVTNGTNWVVITAFTSSTVVTIDASPAWVAQAIKLGGALASPSKALGIGVAQNTYWIKNGSYSMSANPTVNAGNATPNNTTTPNRIEGFNSIRGDKPTGSSRPTITATSTCTTILPLTTQGWWVQYLILDCGTTIANSAITNSSQFATYLYVTVKNFKQFGISCTNTYHSIQFCEASGGTSAATAGFNFTGNGCNAFGCYVHDNACSGVVMGNGAIATVTECLIVNNTGATSDGIQASYGDHITNNTIYGNGRDGIRAITAFNISTFWTNNILANNGVTAATAYGLNFASGSLAAGNAFGYDGNAYWSNKTAARNNCGTGVLDVLLGADPFVSAAGGNFALTQVAIKLLGAIPGTLPGLSSSTGYLIMGAFQPQYYYSPLVASDLVAV